MPNHELSNAGDQPQQNQSAGDDSASALRQDAGFSHVGDSSSNQAWSQMSGAHAGGADAGGGGGAKGSSYDSGSSHFSNSSGEINFADHGDIYGGKGAYDGPSASSEQISGHTIDKTSDSGHYSSSPYAGADGTTAQAPSSNISGGGLDGGTGDKNNTSGGPSVGSEYAVGHKIDKNSDRGNTPDSPTYSAGDMSPSHAPTSYDSNVGAGRGGGGSEGGDGKGSGAGDKHGAYGDAGGGESALDKQSEHASKADAKENYGVPDTQLPSADQVKSGSVQDLQRMADASRKATEDYVAKQGDALPKLGFHGTSAEGAQGIANNPKDDIWVAGTKDSRQDAGTSKHVQDLQDSMAISSGHADRPRQGNGSNPGPILMYDTKNQPEAWSKTNGESGEVKYGMLDPKRDQPIGQISREQLNDSRKEFDQSMSGLKEKSDEYARTPGGYTSEQARDISDRLKPMQDMQRDRELQMALREVAKSNAEKGIAAPPESAPAAAQPTYFSRLISTIRGYR